MPSEALQSGPDGTFVYVAKADGTVEVRKVQTMSAGRARTLVVIAGLQEGEKVVTDGQLRLAPGAKYEVRVPRPRGQAGAAESARPDASASGASGAPKQEPK